MMRPMSSDPAMIHALRARLLRGAPADLPVAPTGTRGETLRRVIREVGDRERPGVIKMWRDALATLHRGGFGTDGALAASRWLGDGNVRFDPDRIWPLGTVKHAARPVAAWLDVDEIGRWLGDAGQMDRDGQSPFAGSEPWAGADDGDGVQANARVIAILGPPDETLAICAARRWRAFRAIDLMGDGVESAAGGEEAGLARASLFHILATQMSACIAAADRAALLRVPVIADRIAALNVNGRTLELGNDERLFFGLAAIRHHEGRSDLGQFPGEASIRSLEDTDFIADPLQRQTARAHILPLLARTTIEAGSGRRRAIDAAVDLARSAGDRVTLVNLLLRRAEMTVGDDADKAVGDATEARRLATAMRNPELVVRTTAWETVLGLLESTRARPSTTLLPSRESLHQHIHVPVAALALSLLASELPQLRETTRVAGPRLLTLARLSGSPVAVAATIELLAMQAVARGDDLSAEALFHRTAQVSEGMPRAAAEAFAALLAARRGARVTATERIVRLSEGPALPARVAAVAAMAARDAMLEALSGVFDAQVGGDDTPARVLGGMAPLPDASEGWWTLYSERLLTGREADIRRQLGALTDRIGPWSSADDDDDVMPAPVGLLAAVGSLLASLGDGRGRQPLLRALVAGRHRTIPEHLEIRILSALSLVLPGDGEEGRAVRERADLLAGQRPTSRVFIADIGPPLTPQAAHERMLGALRDVVAAATSAAGSVSRASGGGGGSWNEQKVPGGLGAIPMLAALESLLGPLMSDHPGRAVFERHCNTMDFDLNEESDEGILVTPIMHGSGNLPSFPPLRFAGPARLPVPITSELIATLRPLLATPTDDTRPSTGVPSAGPTTNASRPGDWRSDPGALDLQLRQRHIAFFNEVQRSFAAHELTTTVVRGALREALARNLGLYRAVADDWHIGAYRRWMDFLRRNGCLEDFRPFRRRGPASA